jgi:hypothetical protein
MLSRNKKSVAWVRNEPYRPTLVGEVSAKFADPTAAISASYTEAATFCSK